MGRENLCNEKRFYVYGLYENEKTNFPFYIGKGTKSRMNDHFRKSKSRNLHKCKKIEKADNPYAKKLYGGLTEKQAYLREWCLINILYDRLTNVKSDYGEGPPSGKQHPFYGGEPFGSGEEHRLYGESLKDETKEKLSKAHKGKTLSEEHKQKISKTSSGRNLSKKHIQKLTGKEKTREHKKNIAEAKKGEKNPQAKLTKKEAEEIKWLEENTDAYQYQIADKYGVDPSQISKISRNKLWSQVDVRKPKKL